MKRIANLLPRIPTLKYIKLEGNYLYYRYCCVAIRYPVDFACAAIQKFEIKLSLSNKPPSFLETKQRFLPNEAPSLPLPDCASGYCRCRFIHYQDRRGRDRRYPFDSQAAFDPGFVGRERRKGIDRRNSTE